MTVIRRGVYRGKLTAKERHEAQDLVMSGQVSLMIATNAFGMEIDKAELRFVVHYNFPGSLEAYYQETGRAGHGGEPARCVLLYLKKDQRTQNFFLAGKYPRTEHLIQVYRVLEASEGTVSLKDLQDACKAVPKTKVRVVLNTLRDAHLVQISGRGARLTARGKSDTDLTCVAEIFEAKGKADKEKLKSMVVFAQTALCRWNAILKYVGDPALPNGCQNCDGGESLKSHPISLQ